MHFYLCRIHIALVLNMSLINSTNEFTFSSFCALYIVSWFQKLKNGQSLDGAVQVSKMATNRSATWCQCVQLARLKFQKYFNHKVQKWVYFYALSIIHDTSDICCKSYTWFILSVWFVLDQLIFFVISSGQTSSSHFSIGHKNARWM